MKNKTTKTYQKNNILICKIKLLLIIVFIIKIIINFNIRKEICFPFWVFW